MGIVSISLSDEALDSLDEIEKTYGLKGRSEAVRRSISAAVSEMQDLRDLKGPVEGVLIIVKTGHADPWMSMIQAKHENEIKTQLHSHLHNHKCLEVMVISSDGERLSAMMREIHSTGKADYVRFVRS